MKLIHAIILLKLWTVKVLYESTDKTEYVLANIDTNANVTAGSELKVDFVVRGTVGAPHTATATLEKVNTGTVTKHTLQTRPPIPTTHSTFKTSTGSHSTIKETRGPTATVATTVGFGRYNVTFVYIDISIN